MRPPFGKSVGQPGSCGRRPSQGCGRRSPNWHRDILSTWRSVNLVRSCAGFCGGRPVNLAVRLAGRQASVGLVNLVGVWGLAFLSTWSPGASPCVDWLWPLASWRVASGVLIGRACAGRVLGRMGAMGGIVAIGWVADGFPRRQAGRRDQAGWDRSGLVGACRGRS